MMVDLCVPGIRALLNVPIEGKYIPRDTSIRRKDTKQIYFGRVPGAEAN